MKLAIFGVILGFFYCGYANPSRCICVQYPDKMSPPRVSNPVQPRLRYYEQDLMDGTMDADYLTNTMEEYHRNSRLSVMEQADDPNQSLSEKEPESTTMTVGSHAPTTPPRARRNHLILMGQAGDPNTSASKRKYREKVPDQLATTMRVGALGREVTQRYRRIQLKPDARRLLPGDVRIPEYDSDGLTYGENEYEF